ncbi:shikimate dehydrogenase [Nocardioides mangrovicus]|uniref:Shikimate dehydrogenase n=1 Tax=Nocardioides mangrovicus TaxID=2478913 RepID=A0A3L8P543_9ACTN|nr:shikimate dehydrogenase [Nocardioides mangrovicus]RLV50254.1 shikimate dehydrogenase [Nocardioides mangrovicus]
MRCAVLGSPIAHSLSPVLHRAAYASLGLAGWSYEAIDVDEAGLPDVVEGLDPTWRGLSLTMPLKRAVMPLLDSTTRTAERAGAANTVLLADGLRLGDNTDVPGMVAALRERYTGPVRTAVVVGGGATASAALLALADLGCVHATLLVRDPARAETTLEVARRHGSPLVELAPLIGAPLEADVAVSTVPAAAQTADLLVRLAHVPVLFDVVYDPWPTPLAVSVGEHHVLVSGLDLLVHQAVLQVGLMTELLPTTAEAALPAMRAAGESALATRGQQGH